MSKSSERDQPDVWTLAGTLVGLVVVCTAIGYGLDRWLGTLPWLMIAGVFVGAGLGIGYLVFILFSSGSGRRPGGSGSGARARVQAPKDDEREDDQGLWP